ncbi:MAG: helicase [Micavibrio aeruginosavorus]|uniref:Helicase n=1 Tax=Micavibrio aeruginosavorus TaxID=349221 RepID=A0A2W5FPM2_9BACT|nr:MAG: helicase [Micavibrio aeruginosavorus]
MSPTNRAIAYDGLITAILGPTNTGKTYRAVEQMLSHHSGIIGFPLRLLARENYDKIVQIKGVGAVALVTGEEKIVPKHARYFICTTEAMPAMLHGNQDFDFVAVDEIQLASDPDRGHVFTDRLLRARGKLETMFMGSETIRPLLKELIPGIEIRSQERFSNLTYTGFKKMTRLPARSAIVAFTINDLYEVADLIRRQRGGTAIVLGALSPRTRNAQVEMYQSGEVDFLVATDAIGMGLNMDIQHVAFASTRKFDGQKMRKLSPAELAQIAGRAGRHKTDGTFGVTGHIPDFDPDDVERIENHRFENLQNLSWRNADLDFSSPKMLLRSLDVFSGHAALQKGWPGDDFTTLEKFTMRDDIMARATTPDTIRLLWDVCQIPDFRKTIHESHHELLGGVFNHLISGEGVLPDDWVMPQIARLDHMDGDVDTLMSRIAHIRTWTYISYRGGWFKDPENWQAKTRAIEDRLSDALHEGLLRRFVDRRSAVLLKGREEGSTLLAGVKSDGTVVVEGHPVGHLTGFRFIPDPGVTGPDKKVIMSVARSTLKSEIGRRLNMILTAIAKQFKLQDDGQIFFQQDASNPLPGQPIARVKKGASLLQPEIELLNSDLLETQDKNAVTEHLQTWVKAHIYTVLEPLFNLVGDETEENKMSGAARGIAFQLFEGTGIVPRTQVDPMIETLDADGRRELRGKKVKLGPLLVFLPELNKPAGVRLRALLWSLYNDQPLPAPTPRDGSMSVTVDPATINPDFYKAIGYPVYGPRAIRIDMLDRVINLIYDNADKGRFRADHKMAEWMGCGIADLYAILEAMGHKRIEALKVEEVAEVKAEEPVEETKTAEAVAPVEGEAAVAAEPPKPEPKAKPVLDEFILRKGKAHQEHAERKPREFTPRDKKPFPQERRENRPGEKPKFNNDKPKFDKKKFDKKKDFKDKKFDEPRTYSANAKVEDNPFAILQQLKK